MSADTGVPAELFQLDRPTCLALLTTQHVGRLILGDVEPAVVPLNYRIADDVITFRTEPGSHAQQAAGRGVTFEVDMFDDRTRSGWSVLVRGRLDATPADATESRIDTWAPGDRDLVMTVTIDTVTGRLLRGAVAAAGRHRADGYL
ncbi:MAG: pyridoxamine 5'-phosphate oxidase family protein [Ilumatobacteraceae bacterium]